MAKNDVETTAERIMTYDWLGRPLVLWRWCSCSGKLNEGDREKVIWVHARRLRKFEWSGQVDPQGEATIWVPGDADDGLQKRLHLLALLLVQPPPPHVTDAIEDGRRPVDAGRAFHSKNINNWNDSYCVCVCVCLFRINLKKTNKKNLLMDWLKAFKFTFLPTGLSQIIIII